MKAKPIDQTSRTRNLKILPWVKFTQNLLFWQATWFLFFQNTLSAAEAVLLYAIFDIGTTLFEVPSGYMSDRIGRTVTLLASSLAGIASMTCFVVGDSFTVFALGQILLGASIAFASGTDSSLLFETLTAEGREDEIEAQELRFWRFTFAALLVSAISGGLLARADPVLPFMFSAIAFVVMLLLVSQLKDARQTVSEAAPVAPILTAMAAAFRKPALLWLFALSVVMYGFSHVPFVFGQPFILDTLAQIGLSGEAPLVSGVVTSLMMTISIAASFAAPWVRTRLGLSAILMLAFAIQIMICALLSLSQTPIAIAILFLRMVPDSLSRPFILAAIQPLLQDGMRATYLSVQSFAGRIVFAASLWIVSRNVTEVGEMPTEDLSRVLGLYAVAGVLIWLGLLFAVRAIKLDPKRPHAHGGRR